ncbi:SDR family oxidoreductase [Pasteurellaceae bacterium LIM206]|nr:SDR family oxidoreductase [Pasteurellaceae bacterium LIM206]
MKSVAIVGLGWLGYPLARHLRQMGWDVKGSKRTHEGVEQMRLERIQAYHLELTPELNADPDDMAALLAAEALVINIPPSRYFFSPRDYVQSIRNLVSEALLFSVNHIIFISSVSVFPNVGGEFNEDSLPQPDNDVGKALLEIEQRLLNLRDIDVDILRLAGLVGEDRHPVVHLAGKRNLPDGNVPVNLVHVDDCVRAIQLLLETSGARRLYHLVAPNHPVRAAYYRRMAKKLALSAPHFQTTDNDVKRIVQGNKICRELGFIYQYPDPDDFTERTGPGG